MKRTLRSALSTILVSAMVLSLVLGGAAPRARAAETPDTTVSLVIQPIEGTVRSPLISIPYVPGEPLQDLTVTAAGPDGTETIAGPMTAVAGVMGHVTWAPPTPLGQVASYTITVVATDDAGNPFSSEFTFEHDRTTAIITPAEGGTFTGLFNGTGAVAEAIAWAVTAGTDTTPVASGSVTPSAAGVWNLDFTATDWYTAAPGGTQFTFAAQNGGEATPAVVHAAKPAPPAPTHIDPVTIAVPPQDGAKFSGTVTGNSDADASIEWQVVLADETVVASGVATAFHSAPGLWSANAATSAEFAAVADGTALTIKARYQGDTAWVVRQAVKDTTAPVITFNAPASPQTGESVHLSFGVSETADLFLSYTTAGSTSAETPITALERQAGNSLAFDWTPPTLPGATAEYTVKLVARDEVQNESAQFITFTHQPSVPDPATPPEVKVHEFSGPADEGVVEAGATVALSFAAKDSSGAWAPGVEYFRKVGGQWEPIGVSTSTGEFPYEWATPTTAGYDDFFAYRWTDGVMHPLRLATVPAGKALLVLTFRNQLGEPDMTSLTLFAGPERIDVSSSLPPGIDSGALPTVNVIDAGKNYEGTAVVEEFSNTTYTHSIFPISVNAEPITLQQFDFDSSSDVFASSTTRFYLNDMNIGGMLHLFTPHQTYHLPGPQGTILRAPQGMLLPVVFDGALNGEILRLPTNVTAGQDVSVSAKSSEMARIHLAGAGPGELLVQLWPGSTNDLSLRVPLGTLLVDPSQTLPILKYQVGDWTYGFVPSIFGPGLVPGAYELLVGQPMTMALSAPATAAANESFALTAEIKDADGNKITGVEQNHVSAPVIFQRHGASFAQLHNAPYVATTSVSDPGLTSFTATVNGGPYLGTLSDTADVTVTAPDIQVRLLENSGTPNDGLVARGTTVHLTLTARTAGDAPKGGVTFAYRAPGSAAETVIESTTTETGEVTYDWEVPTGHDQPNFGWIYQGVWHSLPMLAMNPDEGAVQLKVYDLNDQLIDAEAIFAQPDWSASSFIRAQASGEPSTHFVQAGQLNGRIWAQKDGVIYLLNQELTVYPLGLTVLEVHANKAAFESRQVTTHLAGVPFGGDLIFPDEHFGPVQFPTDGTAAVVTNVGGPLQFGIAGTAGGTTYFSFNTPTTTGDTILNLSSAQMLNLNITNAGTGSISMKVFDQTAEVPITTQHVLVKPGQYPPPFLYRQDGWEYLIHVGVLSSQQPPYAFSLGLPMAATWEGPTALQVGEDLFLSLVLSDAQGNRIAGIWAPGPFGFPEVRPVTFSVDGAVQNTADWGPYYPTQSVFTQPGTHTFTATVEGGPYLQNLAIPSRTVNIEGNSAIAVALIDSGVIPADAQTHTITLHVTRDNLPVSGAKVFVGDDVAEVATTSADGFAEIVLSGDQNATVPIRVRTASGTTEATAWAAIVKPGYGVLDFQAVDRASKPLWGYVNLTAGGYYLDTLGVGPNSAPAIVQAGAIQAHFTADRPDGDSFYLVERPMVAEQERQLVTFHGDSPTLGLLVVDTPVNLGTVDINHKSNWLTNTGHLNIPSTGDLRIWVQPEEWDVLQVYETGEERFGLVTSGVVVNAGETATATMSNTGLARLEPTVLGNINPAEVMMTLGRGDFGARFDVDLAKPFNLTPQWYWNAIHFTIGDARYNWSSFELPGSLVANTTYPFTVGGPVTARIEAPETAEVDRTVTAKVQMANEHGELFYSAGVTAELTDPDGQKRTFSPYYHHLDFTPTKAGAYTLKMSVDNYGPYVADSAALTATAVINVTLPEFNINGGINGRGIARSYTIEGVLNQGVTASTMEYVVNGDWTAARETAVDTFGHFSFSGTLPDTLMEGAPVTVWVRIKGKPGSERRFTAAVDDTAPVIEGMTLPTPSGVRVPIEGIVSDNLSAANVQYFHIQYTTAEPGTNPVWNEAAATGQWTHESGSFQLMAALPFGPDRYRIRVAAVDYAGFQSEWMEDVVDMPNVVIVTTPADGLLTPGQENTITARLLVNDVAEAGLQVTLKGALPAKLTATTDDTGTATFTVHPNAGDSFLLEIAEEDTPIYTRDFVTLDLDHGAVEFVAPAFLGGFDVDIFREVDGHLQQVASGSHAVTLLPGDYIGRLVAWKNPDDATYVLVKPFTVTAGALTALRFDPSEAVPFSASWTITDGAVPVSLEYQETYVQPAWFAPAPEYGFVGNRNLLVLPGDYKLGMRAKTAAGDRIELERVVTAGTTVGALADLSHLAALPNLAENGRGESAKLYLHTPITPYGFALSPGAKLYTDPGEYHFEYSFVDTEGDLAGGNFTLNDYYFFARPLTLEVGDNEAAGQGFGGALVTDFGLDRSEAPAGGLVKMYYSLNNARGDKYVYTAIVTYVDGEGQNTVIHDNASVVLEKEGVIVGPEYHVDLWHNQAIMELPADLAPGGYTVKATFNDLGYTQAQLHNASELLDVTSDMVLVATVTPADDSISWDGAVLPGGTIEAVVRANGFDGELGDKLVTAVSGTISLDPEQVEVVGEPALHPGLAAAGMTVTYDAETGEVTFSGELSEPVRIASYDVLVSLQLKAHATHPGTVGLTLSPDTLKISVDGVEIPYAVNTKEAQVEVLRTLVQGNVLAEWGERIGSVSLVAGGAAGPQVFQTENILVDGWPGYWFNNAPAGAATLTASLPGYLPGVVEFEVADQAVTKQDLTLTFGDLNSDGAINQADVALAATLMGAPTPMFNLDRNQDGEVDLTDLVAVARNAGNEASSQWFGTVEGDLTFNGDPANKPDQPVIALYKAIEDPNLLITRVPVTTVLAEKAGDGWTFRFPKVAPGNYYIELANLGYNPGRVDIGVVPGKISRALLGTNVAPSVVILHNPQAWDLQYAYLIAATEGRTQESFITLDFGGEKGSLTEWPFATIEWEGFTEERFESSGAAPGTAYDVWVTSLETIGDGNVAVLFNGKQQPVVVWSNDATGSGDGWHAFKYWFTADGEIAVDVYNEIVPLTAPTMKLQSATKSAAPPLPTQPKSERK